MDETGRGCVGCGPQEQFRGCADIAIGDDFTPEDLIPQHTYTPVTSLTNNLPPDGTDGNYIDYKDAVNSIKWNRNYKKKWWKNKEQENENEAMILFETLFKNGCCGLFCSCFVLICTFVLSHTVINLGFGLMVL